MGEFIYLIERIIERTDAPRGARDGNYQEPSLNSSDVAIAEHAAR